LGVEETAIFWLGLWDSSNDGADLTMGISTNGEVGIHLTHLGDNGHGPWMKMEDSINAVWLPFGDGLNPMTLHHTALQYNPNMQFK
jgi:hypothetical protein